MQTLLGGQRVGTFKRENKLYDVIVRLNPEERATPGDISGIYVSGRGGTVVSLSAVAHVEEGLSAKQLNHYNRVPSFTISGALTPDLTLGAAIDSLNALADRVLPPGSRTALAGESRELEEGSSALMFAFIMAIVVVYMVLAAQFESLIHPFTVLLAVPLAVTGALATLYLAGQTLNLFSQIGMVLLIGIVTKNSILLVEYTNQLKARGMSTLDAVLESGRVRLRPILMTSVRPPIIALMPIALGLGAGSQSRRPLGYAIVGGLLFSTALTLYLVPVAYVLLDGLAARLRLKRKREVPAPLENGRGELMGAGLLLLVLATASPGTMPAALQQVPDTVPQVTLAEAIRRSANLDPNYVAAPGRSARLAGSGGTRTCRSSCRASCCRAPQCGSPTRSSTSVRPS